MSMTPQSQLGQVVRTLKRIACELVDQKHADAIQLHADGLSQIAETITPPVRPHLLTPQQTRVLAFIQQEISLFGHAPTRKEIADAFGFTSANGAQEHVKALERKGAITLTGGPRGIRVNKCTPSDRPTITLIEGNLS